MPEVADVLDAFFAEHASASAPSEAILGAIETELIRVSAVWPKVSLDLRRFLSAMSRRCGDAWWMQIERLPMADLYLVEACREHDVEAIAVFKEKHLAPLAGVLSKNNIPNGIAGDVLADVSGRLFVADGDKAALIDGYTGKGSLRAWLRVVVTREALHRLRKVLGDIPADQGLAEAMAQSDLPDTLLEKEHYHKHFREAFESAMNGLSEKDRKLLREYYVFGLTIDRLAALYGVHRSCAARWITQARDRIETATRSEMMSTLEVSQREYESVLRMIRSRLDVSVRRHLA